MPSWRPVPEQFAEFIRALPEAAHQLLQGREEQQQQQSQHELGSVGLRPPSVAPPSNESATQQPSQPQWQPTPQQHLQQQQQPQQQAQAAPQPQPQPHTQAPIQSQLLCLKLPDGVYLNGEECLGGCMLVRQCYWDMWQQMEDYRHRTIATERRRGFVVTGTPGVGVSHMAYFVMAMLAAKRKRMVYEADGVRYMIDFREDVPLIEAGDCSDFKGVLCDETVWHLLHEQIPPGDFMNRRPTVIFTHPARPGIQKFLRSSRSCEIFYLPLWTECELLQAVASLMLPLEANNVQKQFQLWGGSARHVLQPNKYTAQWLNEYIADVREAHDITRTALVGSELCGVCCNLVHFIPKEEGSRRYHEFDLSFASQYVADKVIRHLKTNSESCLHRLLLDWCPGRAPIEEACVDLWFRLFSVRGGSLKLQPAPHRSVEQGTQPVDPEPSSVSQGLGSVDQESGSGLGCLDPESRMVHEGPESVDNESEPACIAVSVPAAQVKAWRWDQQNRELCHNVQPATMPPLYWMRHPQHDSTLYVFQCMFGSAYSMQWDGVLQLAQKLHPAPTDIRFVYVVPEDVRGKEIRPWQRQRDAGQAAPPQVGEFVAEIPIKQLVGKVCAARVPEEWTRDEPPPGVTYIPTIQELMTQERVAHAATYIPTIHEMMAQGMVANGVPYIPMLQEMIAPDMAAGPVRTHRTTRRGRHRGQSRETQHALPVQPQPVTAMQYGMAVNPQPFAAVPNVVAGHSPPGVPLPYGTLGHQQAAAAPQYTMSVHPQPFTTQQYATSAHPQSFTLPQHSASVPPLQVTALQQAMASQAQLMAAVQYATAAHSQLIRAPHYAMPAYPQLLTAMQYNMALHPQPTTAQLLQTIILQQAALQSLLAELHLTQQRF